MGSLAYLLNMRISGIKNIEKEIQIEFYGKKIGKNFNPENNKVKAIFGENGTGKTAIITAMDIVRDFVIDRDYLYNRHQQLLLRELINKNSRKFSFKCEYVMNIEHLYIYEYELILEVNDEDEIVVNYESLKYKRNDSKNKQNTLFVCKNGEFTELSIDNFEKEEILSKTKNLLHKQSALYMIFSIMGNDKRNSSLELVYANIFFIMVCTHLDKKDKHVEYLRRIRYKELKMDDVASDKLLEEISSDIYTSEHRVLKDRFKIYSDRIKQLEGFIRLFKPELKKIDIVKRDYNDEFYDCELVMDYGTYKVNKEFESTGIKNIIELFDAFVLASNYAVVFIDEMDANINDVFLCKMIEYFMCYGNGQLCFTSHNIDPMSVLKRNSKSIDFITRDNRVIPWIKNGHYAPDKSYRNGNIEGVPFNIDSTDFIAIFERGE